MDAALAVPGLRHAGREAGGRGRPALPERLLPGPDRGAAQALLAARGHGHRGPRRRGRPRARRARPRPGLRRPLPPHVRGPRPALRPEGEEGRVARGDEPPGRDRREPLPRAAAVVFGLGIRFVGERAAMLLARHFRSLDALAEASVEAIDDIYEIGPAVAESVHQWFRDPANRRLVERLKERASGSRRARPPLAPPPSRGCSSSSPAPSTR